MKYLQLYQSLKPEVVQTSPSYLSVHDSRNTDILDNISEGKEDNKENSSLFVPVSLNADEETRKLGIMEALLGGVATFEGRTVNNVMVDPVGRKYAIIYAICNDSLILQANIIVPLQYVCGSFTSIQFNSIHVLFIVWISFHSLLLLAHGAHCKICAPFHIPFSSYLIDAY